MTLAFLVGSRNFIRFWVSWEDFVLHGYECIHCIAKSCTITAYRWLFRDLLSSLRTLWSAVIKSRKCSALGTTVPVRLLQEALVVFLFKPISQFGPSESPFLQCAYPNLVPLLLAAPLVIREKKLEVSRLPCSGFPQRHCWSTFINQILSEFLKSINQAIHARYLFVLLRVHHFYLCFRFLRIDAEGLTEALHKYFRFFLVLDFQCICWHQIRNPVMEMMEKLVQV